MPNNQKNDHIGQSSNDLGGLRMTPRYKHRVALFICLLLVGEEFTHAKHLNNQLPRDHHDDENNDIEPTPDKPDDDGDDYTTEELNHCIKRGKELKEGRSKIPHPLMDHLHRQSLKEEGGGKKGWINPALIFKGIRIFATGTNFILAGAQLGQSIQKAIDGCCDAAHREACSYSEKFEQANKEVTALSKTADQLQLDAELAQMWIQKITDHFAQILEQLERIDAFQDRLVQEISPDLANATSRAEDKIKQLIKEKDKTLGGIPFVEVDQLYQSTLQKALGIGASVLSLVIPGLFTIYQYSKHKARMRRLGYIELEEDVEFKLPKKSSSSSSLYEATKFNRWTSRRWRKNFKAKDLIAAVKSTFKRGFKRVKKFAAKYLGFIGTVANLAMAGFTIYNMIRIENECADTREKIKCAYIQTKEAQKTIQGHIDEIRATHGVMMEVWDMMRGNITDNMLLKSLNDTGEMMAGAANQSAAMQSVTADIFGFLGEIKTSDDFNITNDAVTQLLRALGKIPFSLRCYISKVNTLKEVISGCKQGDFSMNMLIKESKEVPDSADPNDASDPRNCRDRLGFLYIEDEDIKKAWYKVADEEGYHHVCLMNKPRNREHICKMMKEKAKDAEEIADSMKWDKPGVEEVMDILKKSFSPGEHRLICKNKERYKDNKEKLNKRFKMFFPSYKLDDLYAVECPGPEEKDGENCIQDDAFPPKQLERENQSG